jgi:hypothetical protein
MQQSDQTACCNILGLLSRWHDLPPQHLAGRKVSILWPAGANTDDTTTEMVFT